MATVTRRASDVRINELDLSTSIVNNSNATMAIAVVSGQGDLHPKYYTDYDSFRFDFGMQNAAVSFDHYAARDYFKEGNSCWAVRAIGSGYKHAAALVKNDASGKTQIVGIPSGVVNPQEPDWLAYCPDPAETPLFQITSKRGPGSYGNRIAVTIESQTLEQVAALGAAPSLTTGLLPNGDYAYQIAAISKNGETLSSTEVTVSLTGAEKSVELNWDLVPGALGYHIYGRAFGIYGRLATVGAATKRYVDDGRATADETAKPIVNPTMLPKTTGIFIVNVYDLDQSATRPVENFVCSLVDQVDESGEQSEITQRINPFSKYIRVESNVYSLIDLPEVRSVLTPVALTGGRSGSAPTGTDVANAYKVFENKELYTIDVFVTAGRSSVPLMKELDRIAVLRNDAVAFLDVPSTRQTAQDAVDFRNLTLNLSSSYSALFCSDLLESDPDTGKILYVPPSGAMAGLYARTSRIAQPWFSMAGLNRGLLDVLGIRNSYDDGEATYLYKNQVNYMRKFVGKGIPLWEQSTLYAKNSSFQFLNVRFLFNMMKRAMYEYLIYGLQEPGDDILRRQLKFSLEEYLKLVQSTRGIKYYRTVISDVNNPAALTNSGGLAIMVVVIPILGTREIQLTLVNSKEGLQISESDMANMT